MFNPRLKWKHVFAAAIIGSLLFGMFLAVFCIRQNVSPREFLRSFSLGRQALLSPAGVADKYLSAWEDLQPKVMFALLPEKAQKIAPLETYVKDFEDFPLRPAQHKIISTRIFGAKATVKALVSWPSFETEPTQKEEQLILFLENGAWKISEENSFK